MSPNRPKPHFYCDENFPAYAGEFLKTKGYTVEYPPVDKRGITDVAQLRQASKRQAIFLTIDRDFAMIQFPARRILESSGVVIFHSDDPTKQYKRLINRLLKVITEHRLSGKLCEISVDLALIKQVAE